MNTFAVLWPLDEIAQMLASHARDLLPICIIVSHLFFFIIFFFHIVPSVVDFFFGEFIAFWFRPVSFRALGKEDKLAVLLSAIATVNTLAFLSFNFFLGSHFSAIVASSDIFRKLMVYSAIFIVITYIMAIAMLYAEFCERMMEYSEDAFKMVVWYSCLVKTLYSVIYALHTAPLNFTMLFLIVKVPFDIFLGYSIIIVFSWISFYLFLFASNFFYCILICFAPQYPQPTK